MRRAWWGLVLMLSSATVHADSWAPPPTGLQTWASANKKFSFVLQPGDRRTNASGQLLDAKGALQWSGELVNLTVPLAVLVSDDGRYVATFDDHGHSGGPNAVVVYERGKPRAHLGLQQLVTEREARNLPRSVSNTWWRSTQRFDLPANRLIVAIAQGGNRRPTEDPGPVLERQVDLATGAVLGRPADAPQTAAALLEELKTTPDRWQVLQDLAERHKGNLDVAPLWRSLAFDEKAPLGERSFALQQVEKHLGDAELTRLLVTLGNPKDPMFFHVLGVMVGRKFKPALPAVLEACKRLTELDEHQHASLVRAALTLSESRDDVLAIALESSNVYLHQSTLADLARLSPARAYPFALARLGHADQSIKDTAARIILDSLRGNDPAQQTASYDALAALSREKGSPVARSSTLLFTLGSLAFDRNQLDEAQRFHALGEPLEDPNGGLDSAASHLAQLALIEATRGNEAGCLGATKKVARLPKERSGCLPGDRPARSSSGRLCHQVSISDLELELKRVCGGPLRAAVGFVEKGPKLALKVDLENASGPDFEARDGQLDIRWIHRGSEVLRTHCTLGSLKLLRKDKLSRECVPKSLPEQFGTSLWPLRADVRVTLYARPVDSKKSKPKKPELTRLDARATTFLVR